MAKSNRAKAARLAKAQKAASKKGAKVKSVKAEKSAEEMEHKYDSGHRSVTGVLVSQPTSKDVKIANFSMISHGDELIHDTLIELTIGRRYGLIGRNGSGKSEFMKLLANREVPIPEVIDIFFLEQEAPPTDMTALEYVLEQAKKKYDIIEKELENALIEFGGDAEIVMDLTARLEEMDPDQGKVRAASILHGLGFTKDMFSKATKDMSGGWRMRVALGEALYVRPTLLLLDEPTNHLDLEACVWLEQYLATYPHCLVVVSHSQDFLNGVCTNIIHITPQRQLVVYGGNYDTFIRTKEENEVNQMKQYKKEQDDIKHIKQFIASCGTFSNLVKQAKSKQKILDKMYAAGLTEKPMPEPVFNFQFPDPEDLPIPLAFHGVSFSYSGKPEDYLYENVDIGVHMDSRIALVGPNGAGKSTLLKLMLGELTPCTGNIKRHTHLKFGKYHQHSTEVLDKDATPLEFIANKYAHERKNEEEWRQHLGRYGITGKQQTIPIGTLSDGQKSRLVFALIAKEAPSVLLLDEPTNHLDIECIDSLARAINQFKGGVVLVSHDFRLIDQVAESIWVCDNKTIETWQGGIRDYKKHLIDNMVEYTG